MKVKGTGVRKAASPETEPKFYEMPFVGAESSTHSATEAKTTQPQQMQQMPAAVPSAPQSQQNLVSAAQLAMKQALLQNSPSSMQQLQDEQQQQQFQIQAYQTQTEQQAMWSVNSTIVSDEEDEREFDAILSALIKMPVEGQQPESHPLADDNVLGNLFEMLTE